MTLSRREFLASAGGLAALLSLGDAATASPPKGSRFAVAGTVHAMDGLPPRSGHAALVNSGRIEAVLPVGQVADRPVLAIPNAVIMPGIINCHVHRIHSRQERRERYLLHGVTAIGDTASPLNALKLLQDSPSGTTANAACSGPMLCPPGGYPLPVHSAEHGLVVRSPAHARERVRQIADTGATMIKFALEPGPYPDPWPIFDTPTAAAICDETRKYGLTARCHVEDFGGLQTALEAGVHTVEHVPHRWIHHGRPHPVLEGPAGARMPVAAYRAQLERMVRNDVILTPTLDVLSRSMWDGPELYEPVRHFARIGGRIAVGNDHPYRRADAGMPLREMRLLQRAGLDPSAILISGTTTSGSTCGFTDRGTLSPGMRADMLVLTGDPTTDLGTLAAPAHIIKDGVFIK